MHSPLLCLLLLLSLLLPPLLSLLPLPLPLPLRLLLLPLRLLLLPLRLLLPLLLLLPLSLPLPPLLLLQLLLAAIVVRRTPRDSGCSGGFETCRHCRCHVWYIVVSLWLWRCGGVRWCGCGYRCRFHEAHRGCADAEGRCWHGRRIAAAGTNMPLVL